MKKLHAKQIVMMFAFMISMGCNVGEDVQVDPDIDLDKEAKQCTLNSECEEDQFCSENNQCEHFVCTMEYRECPDGTGALTQPHSCLQYCPGEEPRHDDFCVSDDECKKGYICEYRDIAFQEKLSLKPGICIPIHHDDFCQSDEECAEGYFCEMVIGTVDAEGKPIPSKIPGMCRQSCLVLPIGEGHFCEADKDCNEGAFCKKENGVGLCTIPLSD
ncbi:MAG: hypothetical protein A3I05_06695 [Deltaproteobacteria bacterium RIFCSPLOWO2_02_FULL_44_10]|nr:MAG: hypothetical protein A3C46_06895 [Deltaproteobacteria bacterium RIFCSPHIGHO2_02_FULL_44_16]OGQ46719.1 MAG: hypothetical protein A3I05_06695 [Deltaproteobacteria bacterium RIFCSPLOWO2_02_FULL_44_10]